MRISYRERNRKRNRTRRGTGRGTGIGTEKGAETKKIRTGEGQGKEKGIRKE
jgi:hypothetical protein